MAKSRKKSKMSNSFMDIAMIAGGAIIASQITGIMERSPATAKIGKLRPLVTAGLGFAAMSFGPESVKKIGLGMAGQGLAETVEGFVMGAGATVAPTTTAQTTQGLRMGQATTMNPRILPQSVSRQMGFVPQMQPVGRPVSTYRGVPMR